jgi:hypothetical protein
MGHPGAGPKIYSGAGKYRDYLTDTANKRASTAQSPGFRPPDK